MDKFVNLHNHTEYSSLDGFSQIDKIVERVKAINQTSVAITDHGNIDGTYKFYKACKNGGIKPILGIEMYLTKEYGHNSPDYHITLLAKDNKGWQNILKLTQLSYINFYYKPRINFKDLFAYSEGIICLSGCPQGIIAKHLFKKEISIAKQNTENFRFVFGDDFYVEIMNHGLDFQKELNYNLRNIAKEFGIKTVITNDSHYTKKEHAIYQDYLMCDNLKKTIHDEKRLSLQTDEFYIKRRSEIDGTEEEKDTTLEISDKCNVELKFEGFLLPHIKSEESEITKLIGEGIERYKIGDNETYMNRLREEYRIIKDANLIGYFLIVQDYIKFARENNILVGPGRGSVGGSILAYLIGIHNVDPIKHKLLFSRFYNHGRANSLPDIDVDFPEGKIHLVREYIKKKYGKEKIAHIGTNNYLQQKAALKLICRVLGVDFKTANDYSIIVEDEKQVEKLCEESPSFKEIYDKTKEFVGLAVHSSVHAAGMIISPIDLNTIIPLRINKETNTYISNWDMKDIEEIGLVKFDFLSLNTLDVIDDTLKLIGLNINNIPTDDEETFNTINTTNNVGIFQLSSDGISNVANEMKVSSIDDIAVVVALYRPGPINSGLHKKYIHRKSGIEEVQYAHPLLEPILKDTYGIFVYQEQIIQSVMALANFTETEADLLRKAIGKKIPKLMEEQKNKFLTGCRKKEIEEELANNIWKEIQEFAEYSFNRCIDGDEYITKDNNNGSQYTIKEMYELMNSPLSSFKNDKKKYVLSQKYKKYGYGKARNLLDDRIFTDEIEDIYYQGKKSVFKITLENGREITTTINHKFPTPNGIIEVSKLVSKNKRKRKKYEAIDSLYCMGDYEETKKSYALSGQQQNCLNKKYGERKGFPDGEKNPGYIDGSHIKFTHIKRRLSHIKKCQICSKPHQQLEHHHVDGNRNNNTFINIKKLCPSCHKKEEYILGRKKKFSKGISSTLSKIVSIEYVGEKDVYDIEMKNRPHNLLVNGIATCNSHSVEYGYITYYTAYLKTHYPKEFMASLLNNNYNKPEKLHTYLKECKKLGIEVIPPSVRYGNYDFIVNNNKIVFGLKGINGIGEKTAKNLIDKTYRNFEDFCIKARPSSDTIVALTEAGCFDEFGYNRNTILQSVKNITESLKKNKSKTNSKAKSLFDIKPNFNIIKLEELPNEILASKEFYRLNTYLVYNPLENVDLVTPEELEGEIFIEAYITDIREHITKKKETMAYLNIATNLGQKEAVVFPYTYTVYKKAIKKDTFIAIEGVCEENQILCKKIWQKH